MAYKLCIKDGRVAIVFTEGEKSLPLSELTGIATNAVDAAGVRATTLTGFSTASSAAVTSGSTVLGALGQLQAQSTGNRQLANFALLKAGATKTAVVTKPTLQLDNPLYYVFSVNNNTATRARQVVNTLYIDNLFNSFVSGISLAGRASVAINPTSAGSVTIPLLSDVYNFAAVTINNIVTALSTVTAQVRLLGIGDSITAEEHTDANTGNRDYWNYTSKVTYNILRDRVDRSNAFGVPVLVGNLNFRTRSFTYKGNSLTNRGGNAAQNGWAGCNYLYHASHLTSVSTGGLAGYVPPDVSYYLLGLQGAGNGTWTGSTAQQELIRTTLQGKNTCDKNAILYNWMKVQVGWGGANDTYTGSGTQHTNMDTFATYLLDNPENPFYSKTKAQTGGATNAFSLTTYLSRYKTLADDGTTRLVVGSTAGTKVTDATAYDVCTPTHVVIGFGQNDFWLFPTITATQMAAVLREMAAVITTESAGVKVALFSCPLPGANYPLLYPDGIMYARGTNTNKADLRNAIITNLGINSTTAKATGTSIYYAPIWETMYPPSGSQDVAAETAGRTIHHQNTASTPHPGIDAHASMGDALYGWVYYSISN